MSDEEDVKIDQGNSIIYITEQASINWTMEATDAYAELYAESQDLFSSGTLKTRRAVFDWISSQLAKKGLFYHWTQCENKWKSLKRAFVNRVQKNPYILENPSSSDALLMEIFKKEKNSPIEIPTLSYSSSVRDTKAVITKSEIEDDSIDDLVDALVNNDETYLETLANCTEESEENQKSQSEHTYSSRVRQKSKIRKANENHQRQGTKRQATSELDLDLANELVELRNSLNLHHNSSRDVLRQSLASHDKLVKIMYKMERQREESLQLQKENARQLKIQNSLLAKLVHHFVNNNSSQ